jgi:hypothetical protein
MENSDITTLIRHLIICVRQMNAFVDLLNTIRIMNIVNFRYIDSNFISMITSWECVL